MRHLVVYLSISVLACSNVRAQLTLSPELTTSTVQPLFFHVISLTDSVASKSIGSVYAANKSKSLAVQLNDGASSYFLRLLRKNFDAEKPQDSINICINKLKLTERKTGDILEGTFSITVSYQSKSGLELLTKETSASYKRTFGSATPKVFQQVVNQAFLRNITYFNLWFEQNLAYHPAFVTESKVIVNSPYSINVTDTIYYDTRPITWEDFRGKPFNPGGRYSAAIFPNIAFDLEMVVKDRTLLAYFTPKVYMIQGMSWVKDHNLNNYSLEHEQLHFDIAKIAMNRMTKRLADINALTPEDLQSEIQYEYIEAYREMNSLQEAYDGETGHGVNKSAQAFWKSQIREWLKE